MGNDLVLPRGDQRELDDATVKALLRASSTGETCLLRSVKASTSGSQARQRLEANCAALRQQWKLQAESCQQLPRKPAWRRGAETLHAADPALLLRQMLDAQNNKGETALSVASQMGMVEAVQYLLEQGANPWLSDRLGGRTALHTACLNGHHLVVKVLLEQLPSQWLSTPSGARARYVNCTTVSGFTPLHCAACSGDGPTIKAVLAHSPALLACSAHMSWEHGMDFPIGTTALHVAASKGNMVAVKQLLRHYVRHRQRVMSDPRLARNSQGELPWQVAYNLHHPRPLTEMLHPSVPLASLFPEQLQCTLQALASAALQQHLLHALDSAQQLQQACAPPQAGPDHTRRAVLALPPPQVPQQPPLGPHFHGEYAVDVPYATPSTSSCVTSGVTSGVMSCMTSGSLDPHARASYSSSRSLSGTQCLGGGYGRDSLYEMADLQIEEIVADMLADSSQVQQTRTASISGDAAPETGGLRTSPGTRPGDFAAVVQSPAPGTGQLASSRPSASSWLSLSRRMLGKAAARVAGRTHADRVGRMVGATQTERGLVVVRRDTAEQPGQPSMPQQPAAHAPHAASSPHSSSIEEAADDDNDDDYDGLLRHQLSLCNICMDMEARMELAPCTHRLCEGCARHMVQNMKTKPVDCPFCRRSIGGFVAAV